MHRLTAMNKKHLLSLGAIACSILMLASCDKVEASLPGDKANETLLNIDTKIDANTQKEIYDALVVEGPSNSEKVLNNVLYMYGQSLFGRFFDKGEEKGLKTILSEYISDNSKTADLDDFIKAHKALQVKNSDGSLNVESSRARAKFIYEDILYRVYENFLTYIKNSSYQERNIFKESKFHEAQVKAYYVLGDEYFQSGTEVDGDLKISETPEADGQSNKVINTYFKNVFGTYQDYIEKAILPDIYRNEMTTEYLFTQNTAQINLTAARKVNFISLEANAEYNDAVSKLMQEYSRQVIQDKYINMDEYPLSYLSKLYKGADKTINDNDDDGLLANKIYKAAGWTKGSVSLGSQTIKYWKQSKFGTMCEKYLTLNTLTSRDDSNYNSIQNEFTSDGTYSRETGFKIKWQSLISESNTTSGWYTAGGLGALPASLSTRIFKSAVANEVDDQENIKKPNPAGYTGGDAVYGNYVEGKYFLVRAKTAETELFPYIVEDGTKEFIVQVDEATKSSKFSSASEGTYTYNSRGVLEGEKIARKVAYSLSNIDTWKTEAKTFYVKEMAAMYHDDSVFSYFKSQFPDLFDK